MMGLRGGGRWLCAALLPGLLSSALGACQHEYLYPPDRLPSSAEGGERLMAPSQEAGGEPVSLPIQEVRLSRTARGNPYSLGYAEPSAAQLEQLRAGKRVEGFDALSVKVDTTPWVWEDYAIPGMWTGAVLGAGLGVLVGWGLANAPGTDNKLPQRLGLAAIFGVGLGVGGGLEGLGVGALLGAIFTGGVTDLRQEEAP